jgi:uracil-DNA glycosylase family 4
MYETSGIGPSDPKLLVVSDFPNRDEVTNKYALEGKIGNTVNMLLAPGKLKLQDTYRTHVIKVFRDDFLKKKKADREKAINAALNEFPFVETLTNEIRGLRPNAILALGETSLNVLTGLKGIDNYRGSILTPHPLLRLPENIKVIPTLHPRNLYMRWNDKPLVQFDVNRAIQQSKNSFPHKRKELLWRVHNFNELQRYWERAKKGEFMVFDIETWRGYITCIGFCTDGYEAVSVPIFDYTVMADQSQIWRLLGEMLGSSMPKVNQNIKYDLHYIEKWGWRVENVQDDTSLLGRIIYAEFKVRLALLQSLYTEIPYHKDEGHDYSPQIHSKEQLYLYNAKDCLATWQVYKGQVKDAKELKVWDFHRKNYWENNLFHIYRKMDGRGIRVDFEQRNKLISRYEAAVESHAFAVEDAYGQKLNIRSPKQVAEFVYEYLECPKIYKKSEEDGVRRLDTGKEALEELYVTKIKSPDVKKLLKRIIIVRKLQTILNYLNYLVHPDGRIRTSTKLNGTKSGRTSQTTHEDSMFFINKKDNFEYASFGGSLQVIPKRPFEAEEFEGEVFGSDVSSIFVPTPGYCFVEGDGGAAEARVVAVLSGDFETLERMDREDLHKLTATWTTGKRLDQITSFDREVYGKRPRHAGNYDMTAYRFALMIHKSVIECQTILTRFHDNVPKVRGVFHTLVRQYVDTTGMLRSPHGRIRQFFGHRNDTLYKEAYSMIPQATVSDHTKFTMPLIIDDVPSCEFLLEKHDSLLMEVPIVEKEAAFESFRRNYERPISFREGSFVRDFDLVIPAEIKWSDENWMNMKKVKF